MVSFVEWLGEQTDRDDEVGDLARDVECDTCEDQLATAADVRAHIQVAHRGLEVRVDEAIATADSEHRRAVSLR